MSLFSRPPATPTGQPQGNNSSGGATITPAAAPTGNLFGSTTPAVTSAPSGGLFGGAPSTINTGLFGGAGPTPAISTPATGGGIFGTATPATTSGPSGGLFGAAPVATNTPANGGLFGTAPTTSAPASGGLFGAAASNTAPKLSLFGNTPTTGTGATTGGGLFGSAPSANTGASSGGGLFGATQPVAGSTTGSGLFGATAPTTSTAFGRAQQHQQQLGQMVPAATVDASKLTPTTRFSDCHQDVQQALETIEADIQNQISLSCQLADRFPTHREALESIPIDASVLTNRLATTKSFQMSDQASYDQARSYHDADDQASTLSIRTLDLFRLPHAQRSQYIQRTSSYSVPQRENEVTGNKPMISYFNKQADEMERKMDIIGRIVRQVEESLISVEAQAILGARGAHVDGRDLTAITGGIGGRQDARRLNSALREFNDALKGVSGRIVDAREGLEALNGRR